MEAIQDWLGDVPSWVIWGVVLAALFGISPLKMVGRLFRIGILVVIVAGIYFWTTDASFPLWGDLMAQLDRE